MSRISILRTIFSCALALGLAYVAYLWFPRGQRHPQVSAILDAAEVRIPDDWLDTRGWAKYGFSFHYPSLARIHCCAHHVPEYGDVFVESVYPKETPPGPERSLQSATDFAGAPHLTAMPGGNLLRAEFSAGAKEHHPGWHFENGSNTYIAPADLPYLTYIRCTNNHCVGQVAFKALPIQYNIEYIDERHGAQIIEAANHFIESWRVPPRTEPISG